MALEIHDDVELEERVRGQSFEKLAPGSVLITIILIKISC